MNVQISRSRSPHRGGFMLIEMMMVVSLLAVFGLIAVRLIRVSLELPKQTAEARATLQLLDAAIDHLRRDVWNATAMKVPDDTTLKLTLSSGTSITWHSDGKEITRTAGAEEGGIQRWSVNQPTHFTANSPTARLIVPDRYNRPATVEFISQRLLAGGTQ